MGRPPNTADDFWSHVSIRSPDECWPWMLSTKRGGYGQFKLGGTSRSAHKLAFELHHGVRLPTPKNITPQTVCVLHRCNNPPCCNPAHLWLGTPKENIADAYLKGRFDARNASRWPESRARGLRNGKYTKPENTPRGSSHPRARLTEEDVAAIRRRFTGKRGECVAIAKEYGMRPVTIYDIRSGKIWRHVTPDVA